MLNCQRSVPIQEEKKYDLKKRTICGKIWKIWRQLKINQGTDRENRRNEEITAKYIKIIWEHWEVIPRTHGNILKRIEEKIIEIKKQEVIHKKKCK